MTIEAIEQRRNAVKSRWAKWRTRNRKKRKGISTKSLALLVAAATLLGSAALIYVGETELWATQETRDGAPTLEIRP